MVPVKGKLIENLLNSPQDSYWFNKSYTAKNETKNEIMLEAFLEVKSYYQNHNLDIQTFTWGQLHKVQFSHILGSRIPQIAFFNAGGLQPSPGDMYTINVGTYTFNETNSRHGYKQNIFDNRTTRAKWASWTRPLC